MSGLIIISAFYVLIAVVFFGSLAVAAAKPMPAPDNDMRETGPASPASRPHETLHAA